MRFNMRWLHQQEFLRGNFLLLLVTCVLIYSTQSIPYTYESFFLNLGADAFLLSIIGFGLFCLVWSFIAGVL